MVVFTVVMMMGVMMVAMMVVMMVMVVFVKMLVLSFGDNYRSIIKKHGRQDQKCMRGKNYSLT